MKQPKYFLLLFFLIGTLQYTNAQEKKKIEIIYAGRLNADEAQYPGARILTHDASEQVHVAQGSIDIWCDKAIYYGQENFVEAYGNVFAKQGDTVNLRSKYIEYSGKTQLTYASGDVVLTDPTSNILTAPTTLLQLVNLRV